MTSPNYSRDVRYWALMALGSVESSAEKRIAPYQEPILQALNHIITNPHHGPSELTVRGQALMCAGQLASAVGKEKFPPQCIELFTKYALEYLAMDKFELRETSISYFAELARILKNDMAPVINQVLDEILKSCKSEAGMKTEVEPKPKEAFSLDSDSEDEAELVGMDVDVNFLDEKSAAVHALGNIGLFCSSLILPRLKEIIDVLGELADYFHENIRYHVCMTYLQIGVGLAKHFTQSDDKFKWEKGLPVKNPLPAPVIEYMEQVIFPHYFDLFDHEGNKEVIEKTLECFREMCEVFGPGAVEKHSDRIVETILLLLDKKAFCQTKGKEKGDKEEGMDEDDEGDGFQDEDEEEDEDDEEDMDHDEILLGNTTDLIIELARALGDQFLTYLTRIGPSLVRYLDDSHPRSDIEMVIGCLAETFNACTAGIPVYFKDFLQILLKNSRTDDSSLNRNVSYAMGILAQHSGVLLGQHIQPCLEALNTMYAASTEQDAKDNIISASCRLMQYYPHQVPVDTMLPFVFQNIPFSGDPNENETVLRYAMNMHSLAPEKVSPFMQQVTMTALKVLVDEKCDEIPESFKFEVGKFIKGVIMATQLPLLQ